MHLFDHPNDGAYRRLIAGQPKLHEHHHSRTRAALRVKGCKDRVGTAPRGKEDQPGVLRLVVNAVAVWNTRYPAPKASLGGMKGGARRSSGPRPRVPVAQPAGMLAVCPPRGSGEGTG